MLILPVEERDPDLFRGGQTGDFPAPLDEVGHGGHVGVQTRRFSYPVVYDQTTERYVWDRGKLVYGAAGLHVAADEVGGDDGQHVAADTEVSGNDGQQVEQGAGHHGKPAGHGQGQHGVSDEIDKEEVGIPGELRKV